MDSSTFTNLPLGPQIINNLESLGYHSMTPIQEETLPAILEGKDILGQAKTGSGKTAAFGLGIISKIDLKNLNIQALVLCPTRELAEQVANEIRRLARFTSNTKVLAIFGGTLEFKQVNSLKHGAHIIVATPGRVLKHLKKGAIDLEQLKVLVLDEADRMLDMGFEEQMDEIATYTPKDKQTLLFSATYPHEIKSLCDSLKISPEIIKIDAKHEKEVIEQKFIKVKDHQQKFTALLKVLANFRPESTLVFCKTKFTCDEVFNFFLRNQVSAIAIHGDLDQNERTLALTKFSNRSALILVATDVAARGLDIKDLQAVINFDLAIDAEVYTHRIGRTARAGKTGHAFSFFVDNERGKLSDIEAFLERKNELMDLTELSGSLVFDLKPPMRTMVIGAGKKDKIRPGDILGALIGEAGLQADQVGIISIFDTSTLVAVKSELMSSTISKLKNGKIKGRSFRVFEAKNIIRN